MTMITLECNYVYDNFHEYPNLVSTKNVNLESLGVIFYVAMTLASVLITAIQVLLLTADLIKVVFKHVTHVKLSQDYSVNIFNVDLIMLWFDIQSVLSLL